MTRKHYIMVAAAIKAKVDALEKNAECEPARLRTGRDILSETAEMLADAFEQDNPNFNWTKFVEACGF